MNTNIETALRTNSSLISLKKLAVILDAHYQTVYGWVRDGKIPYTRIGSRIKFEGPVVADWFVKRRVGSG